MDAVKIHLDHDARDGFFKSIDSIRKPLELLPLLSKFANKLLGSG
jgi:hypothetical protein